MIPVSHSVKPRKNIKLSGPQSILVLSDIHLPYHDVNAVERAINHGKRKSVDTVILMGDTLDCHMVSSHRKAQGAPDMKVEVETGIKLLTHLRNSFPDSGIYMMEGNHELRMQRYIHNEASQLKGFDDLYLPSLLQLDSFDIKWLPTGVLICAGKMTFLHGHEMLGISGINPARKLFAKTKMAAMCGHLHRPDTFFTRNARGEGIECHVVGTLGELEPEYMPKNDWRNGYAIVDIARNGAYKVNNVIL